MKIIIEGRKIYSYTDSDGKTDIGLPKQNLLDDMNYLHMRFYDGVLDVWSDTIIYQWTQSTGWKQIWGKNEAIKN